MKKLLLVIAILLFAAPFTKASHIVGGDLQVIWVGPSPNQFQIKLRVFRSCSPSSAGMPTTATVRVHDLVTYAQTQQFSITNPTITPNLPFGDACFTPTGLCVDLGVFTQNVTIPNNPNGYFLEYQICCRNAGITNLAAPTGEGMTFYCEIPDPGNAASLNNSNPDMGIYPLDAYFCVNNPKQFSFNVTDPDGDSLAYSLVTPLDNGAVQAAPAFPYLNVVYAAGYNLQNMIGGAQPMVIDSITGIITANPSIIGTWVFGVLVEEFRDINGDGIKDKIGETRRDAQYESLVCTGGNPPSFLNAVPVNGQTVQIPYNKLYCKDLIFNDINATDTLYIEMISPIFDSLVLGNDTAWQAWPTPDVNGDYHYFYNYIAGPPATWADSVVIPPNTWDPIVGAEWNIGTVAQRFCWTPPCGSIDSIYPFQINAFSLGCDGKAQDSIIFNIQVIPPPTFLPTPGDLNIPYGEQYCQDIIFEDTSIVDLLDIKLYSEIFGMGATIPTLPTNYLYGGFVTTGVPNDAPNQFSLGSQFCWRPDCEHIGGVFLVRAILSSLDCPSANSIQDTIEFNLTVTPPFDSLDVISNVFTPNGDGINDFYTFGYTNELGDHIGGVSNPCNDHLEVQIFNRWGILIYENENLTDPTFQWDGKNKSGNDVPAGTYFVLVQGIYGSEEVLLDQRSVTVLR